MHIWARHGQGHSRQGMGQLAAWLCSLPSPSMTGIELDGVPPCLSFPSCIIMKSSENPLVEKAEMEAREDVNVERRFGSMLGNVL